MPFRQALPLACSLVGVATWLLFWLEQYLLTRDHTQAIRPFGIEYFILVVIMTAYGGRRAGWLTLLLADGHTKWLRGQRVLPGFEVVRDTDPQTGENASGTMDASGSHSVTFSFD